MRKIYFLFALLLTSNIYSQQRQEFGTPVTEGVTVIRQISSTQNEPQENRQTLTSNPVAFTAGIPTGNSPEVGITEGQLSVSQSGAAVYEIPINVPTGINGVVPQISLTYDSQSNNGIAGYGWKIKGLSSISRIPSTKFHDGLNDVVDYDSNDRFSFDGQRLILKSGIYGGNGATYETEGSSNIRITSYGTSAYQGIYGPNYFLVQYPDGSIAYYGSSTNSSSQNEWALTYWQNAQGARISYFYTTTNNNLSIQYIRYGTLLAQPPVNEIEFVYKTRQRPEQSYIGNQSFTLSVILSEIKIKSQNTGFRNYLLGHDVTNLGYERLTSITEKSGDLTKSFNPTVFSYDDTNGVVTYNPITTDLSIQKISSLTASYISGDFNGNGKMDFIVYPKNTAAKTKYWVFDDKSSPTNDIGWGHDVGAFEEIFPISWLGGDESTGYQLMDYQAWAVIKKNANDISITAYSRGSGPTPIRRLFEKIIPYSSLDGNTPKYYYSGDFNGDGLTDVLVVDKSTKKTYFIPLDKRLTVNYISHPGVLTEAIADTDRVAINDFNGDGKSDLFHFKNGKIRVYSIDDWTQLEVLAEKTADNDISLTKPILMGDYNGDGKADFIIPKGFGNNYWKYTSAGTDFVKTSHTYSIEHAEVNDYYETRYMLSSDFNNDGKTDLALVKCYKNEDREDYQWSYKKGRIIVTIFRNTGNDFVSDIYTSGDTGYEYLSTIKPEPLPIILTSDKANKNMEISLMSNNMIFSFKAEKDFSKEKLLRGITVGNGKKEIITYDVLDASPQTYNEYGVYKTGYKQNYPNRDIVVSPGFSLVSKIEEQSISGYRKRLFKYYGAVSNTQGLGFLGFSATMNTNWFDDNSNAISNISKFDLSRKGVNTENYSINFINLPNDNLSPANFISRSLMTYDYTLESNKVYKIKRTGSISYNGLEGTSKEITTEYDQYLNPISNSEVVKSGTSVQQTKSTSMEYYNEPLTSVYYIGRPKKKNITVTNDNNTITGEEIYTYNPNHLLSQIKKKGHNTEYLTEDNIYDSYGNVTKKTISAPGLANRITQYEYEPTGRFLTKNINIEGLATQYVYDTANGLLLSETNPYGLVTSYEYDTFGKRKKITDYLGKKTELIYSKPEPSTSQITVKGDDGSSRISKFDDKGREIINGIKNVDNTWSYTKIDYDIHNREAKISEPYNSLSTGPSQFSTTSFDMYGRPVQSVNHTGKTTTISYSGLSTTVEDGVKTTTTEKDAIGNIKSLTDNGGTITYSYFADGNLKQSNYAGTIISLEQDGWGRKTKLTDPSAGVYQYEYNHFGEVTKEITPKGTTTYVLDDFGKITEKTIEGDLTNSKTTYSYDPQTKLLTSNRYDDFIEGDHANYTYQYDSYKRLSQTNESRYLAFYQRAMLYDEFGRADRQLYTAINTADNKRSDKWVKNLYRNGHHWKILDNDTNRVLWEVSTVNARGQITLAKYGTQDRFNPGLQIANNYDDYGFPTEIKYYKPGPPVLIGQPPIPDENYLVLGYSFNPITGNLNSRYNSQFNWNENFQYDSLDRLTQYTDALGGQTGQRYDNRGRIIGNEVGRYGYSRTKPYQNTSIDLNEPSNTYYTNREGLFNDSMEEQKGWTTYFYYPNISYDSSKFHTGEYSLKITNTTSSEIIALSETRIPINNTVDTEYTYSAWVYSDGAQPEVFLYMGTQNVLNSFDHHDIATTNVTGQWVKVEKTVLVPASMKYLSLRLDNNGNGTIWYDDVRIKKTSNAATSLRELNITYNTFKSPVQIEETGVDKISFIYNFEDKRSSMFYGGLQSDKMLRPNRRHYSIDGSMEIKHNTETGAVEFITYVGGDAYSAPIILRSDGITQEYLFLCRDHLGSILTIANEAGNILEKRMFDAWGNILKVHDAQGNELDGLTLIERGYTGHEHLESVGIIHMNGRLYDAKIHRFLQPDNNIQDPYNTQNFNRYGYTLNNPLSYTDPSGEAWADVFGFLFSSYIHGAASGRELNPLKWDSTALANAILGPLGGYISNEATSSINSFSSQESYLKGLHQLEPYSKEYFEYQKKYQYHTYVMEHGSISMPKDHYFAGINMTALSEGNFVQRFIYESANTVNIPIQYLMFRSVNDGSMRNLDGTSTTTDQGVMAFGTLALQFLGGSRINGVGSSTTVETNVAKEEMKLLPEAYGRFSRFEYHFEKHASEWGIATKEAYYKRALSLLDKPIGGNIQGFTNNAGYTFRMNMRTGEFGVMRPNGVVETFYRRLYGVAKYWTEQVAKWNK